MTIKHCKLAFVLFDYDNCVEMVLFLAILTGDVKGQSRQKQN